MTEIDFYVLADADESNRERLACRLAEKAFGLGHRIYLNARDAQQARALDDLLWTFRDGAFLPHALLADDATAPIVIGAGEEPAATPDLMINLAGTAPAFFTRFDRIAELVNEEPAVRDAGRERFRFYRDRGYSLRTHKL
ncbi:MAG TPA: DNA polymerase III subunit chi [Gammaproteobacteria bacterium]